MQLFIGILPVLISSVVLLIGFIFGMMVWVRMSVKGRMYCIYYEKNRHVGGELLKLPAGESQQMIQGKDGKMYIVDPDRQYWAMYPPGLPGFVQEPVPTQIYNREDAIPLGTSMNANSAIRTYIEQELRDINFEPNYEPDIKEWLEASLKTVEAEGLIAPRAYLVATISNYDPDDTSNILTVEVGLNGNSDIAIRAVDPLHREIVANAQTMQNVQDTAFMQAAIKMASEHLGEGGRDYGKWSFYLLLGVAGGLGFVGWIVFDLAAKLSSFMSLVGGAI